jgi:hypothetical protein
MKLPAQVQNFLRETAPCFLRKLQKEFFKEEFLVENRRRPVVHLCRDAETETTDFNGITNIYIRGQKRRLREKKQCVSRDTKLDMFLTLATRQRPCQAAKALGT